MFIRFQYYNGYIELLHGEILYELKKDIIKDYDNGVLEYPQYKALVKKLDKKIKQDKLFSNI